MKTLISLNAAKFSKFIPNTAHVDKYKKNRYALDLLFWTS